MNIIEELEKIRDEVDLKSPEEVHGFIYDRLGDLIDRLNEFNFDLEDNIKSIIENLISCLPSDICLEDISYEKAWNELSDKAKDDVRKIKRKVELYLGSSMAKDESC